MSADVLGHRDGVVRHPAFALSKSTRGDGATGPPVYLNDTERMLLASCMDVDPYAPSQTLAPTALPHWLRQPHHGGGDTVRESGGQVPPLVLTDRGGSGALTRTAEAWGDANISKRNYGRVVSMGRLAASKSTALISLAGIHMLVRACECCQVHVCYFVAAI
jgi:hypothetical protein